MSCFGAGSLDFHDENDQTYSPTSVHLLNDFEVTSSESGIKFHQERPTGRKLFPSGQENGISSLRDEPTMQLGKSTARLRKNPEEAVTILRKVGFP